MIAAMREKLLKGNNLPASPATLTPVHAPASVVNDDEAAEELKEDEEQHEEGLSQTPKHQRQGTFGSGNKNSFSYNEWQKKNFDNILQAL